MAKNVLTDNFSAPLNGATAAKVVVDAGDGNLAITRLAGDEQALAAGTLQYFENEGLPIRTLVATSNQATLTVQSRGSGRVWFHLPWTVANGATEWQVGLNPAVSYDLIARCAGGNVKLDLAGIGVTRVAADSGGGNLDVVLPANAANLSVAAKTGAGNVSVEVGSGVTGSNMVSASSGAGNVDVRIPIGLAARILSTTGLGKVTVDPRFSAIDKNTYQSPDFDSAADKVEITVKSGAGNVSISVK